MHAANNVYEWVNIASASVRPSEYVSVRVSVRVRDWCKHRRLCVGGLKQSHIALGANEIDAMSYRIQEFLDKVCQV